MEYCTLATSNGVALSFGSQDSQISDSTVTEVDIMSVSVDEEGGEVLKGGRLEGEVGEEIRDREEEDELFPDDWWSGGERWGRGSQWSRRNSSSDGEDVGNEQVRRMFG